MGIQWNDKLATGIEEIDRQHQELFRRFNMFLDACDTGKGRDELVAILQFLEEYVQEHFATEERLQREMQFSQFEVHRGYHQGFVANLAKLKKRFLLEGAKEDLVSEINKVVVRWLLLHITEDDKVFAKEVKARIE